MTKKSLIKGLGLFTASTAMIASPFLTAFAAPQNYTGAGPSHAETIDVTAHVDSTMTFNINNTAVDFGTLVSTASRWATADAASLGSAVAAIGHDMTIATNAVSGMAVVVTGSTLTGTGSISAQSISAVGATFASLATGTEQFGIRLNRTVDGGAGAAATTNYADAAKIAFASGNTVASVAAATNTTTWDVYYEANISSVTEAGDYATTLTYTATATF